jgi:hypothetical protein
MRLNYREVLPDALKAMLGLERVAKSYNRMLWTALRRKAAYLPG